MTTPITFHLIQQLAQKGVLDLDDIEEMARRLHEEGEEEDARMVRGAYMEAHGTSEADFRRSQMHVVPIAPDGGNRG
jgi:hypothetical protein